MFNNDSCCAVDPIAEFKAENAELKKRLDELMRVNEELRAVNAKAKEENAWLRNECDRYQRIAQLHEAQMEVVRLIFGGGSNG